MPWRNRVAVAVQLCPVWISALDCVGARQSNYLIFLTTDYIIIIIAFLQGIRNYIYSIYSMFLWYNLLQLCSSYNSLHM